jgi:formate hydrogenlyase transcriptional activator
MFGGRMNKEINAISEEAMEIIRNHSWPGNIRELQNFVERAVIMSPGPVLRPPSGDLKLLVQHSVLTVIPTLAQAERDHILEVLKHVGGRIGGREGAAARLGLPRTTLLYRMRRLGIRRARSAGGAVHDAAPLEGLRNLTGTVAEIQNSERE